MSRTFVLSLVALAGLAIAGVALGSAQARPSLHVAPAPVAPGARVHVYGSAGSCAAGNHVTAISSAFPGHAFGQGTLTGLVHANHTFSFYGHVRSAATAGSYAVTARCAGGNLGVLAHVHVS